MRANFCHVLRVISLVILIPSIARAQGICVTRFDHCYLKGSLPLGAACSCVDRLGHVVQGVVTRNLPPGALPLPPRPTHVYPHSYPTPPGAHPYPSPSAPLPAPPRPTQVYPHSYPSPPAPLPAPPRPTQVYPPPPGSHPYPPPPAPLPAPPRPTQGYSHAKPPPPAPLPAPPAPGQVYPHPGSDGGVGGGGGGGGAGEPRVPIVDTAYAPLYNSGSEASGYGLYSYVILMGFGDRDRAFVKTIVESTPGAEGLPWPRAQINLLLLPTRQSAATQCVQFSAEIRMNCIQTQLNNMSNYDYNSARTFLYKVCNNATDNMKAFCASAFGRGPFLLTYSHPASKLSYMPPPFLFVDLSTVEEGAFSEYLEAYKGQVKREDITDGSRINTVRLKILSLILSGAGILNPVEKALAEILHVSGQGAGK